MDLDMNGVLSLCKKWCDLGWAVQEQMEKVIARAKTAEKLVGTFADDITSAKRWMDAGVMYIAISVDVGIFYDACRNIVTSLSEG